MKKSQKTQLFEEKEGQYCSRFDIAIGGIIIYDLETGRMVEANPTAYRMYNYTHEEFLGMLLTPFIHPPGNMVSVSVSKRFNQTAYSSFYF